MYIDSLHSPALHSLQSRKICKNRKGVTHCSTWRFKWKVSHQGMSLVILLSATSLHCHIHQCLIRAIHQCLICAKCCSSVPLLTLSKSLKNTATYTRIACFSQQIGPFPHCACWPDGRKEVRSMTEHGGLALAQGQVRKKKIAYTKLITHKTIWLHCFKLMPFVANMSLSAVAQKTDINQKPEFTSSLVSSTS